MGADSRLGGRPRTRLVAQVRARHQPCALCGLPINQQLPRTGRRHPLSSVVDEWIPRSKGGPVNDTNCVEMHSACNATKSNHWPITPELRRKARRQAEHHLGIAHPATQNTW